MGQIGMEVPDLGIYKDKDWPEAQKAHAAMITLLDKDVGLLLSKLSELNIDDRTLVIFTSDNGPHNEGGADYNFFDSNGPLKGMKRDLYEGGIRVPMIARWPEKINAGGQSDHISAFWDFLPTACDIAGIASPENIDGISFLPAMTGGEQEEHDYLYWEFMEWNGRLGIRKGNWKAVKYDMSDNPDAPIQLYDLSTDIGEEKDIAVEHPDIVSEMANLMKTSRTLSGDFKFAFEKEK